MDEFYAPSSGADQRYPQIIQRSTTLPRRIDPDTGEMLGGEPVSQADHTRSARARRYRLLDAIRRIEPRHRTAQCLWARRSKDHAVQVVRDLATGSARYEGLRICGSVWTCPCCAAKISERRAKELTDAVTVARNKDIEVALLTVTVPHARTDSLANLLAALRQAWRSFTTGRISARLRAAMGLVGTVRNLEVTYGKSGWHPHFHALLFHQSDPQLFKKHLAEIQRAWGQHWQNCAEKAGLSKPSKEHGLTIQPGDYAARYISKWGMEQELAKSQAKKARKGGRTPFDIASDFADDLDKPLNAALWREWTAAIKGQRQLFWSKGLKELLEVPDKDDQKLAEEKDDRPTTLVVALAWAEWHAVRVAHRAELLALAEQAPELIRGWLDERVRLAATPRALLRYDRV